MKSARFLSELTVAGRLQELCFENGCTFVLSATLWTGSEADFIVYTVATGSFFHGVENARSVKLIPTQCLV